jgi:hypothetical protein
VETVVAVLALPRYMLELQELQTLAVAAAADLILMLRERGVLVL